MISLLFERVEPGLWMLQEDGMFGGIGMIVEKALDHAFKRSLIHGEIVQDHGLNVRVPCELFNKRNVRAVVECSRNA